MNILHMSDLHLGRRFYNLSFLPIQQALLQEVLQIIDDQQVTVLLLCGDIYDKPVPPADAVQLLDWFLTQLAERSVHVCMISGNHDSPERLQFGSDLLQKNQIHIAGTFSGKMETVSLSDDYGTLTISMLPYVKLAQLSVQFPEQSFATLDDGIRAVLEQTPPDPNHRNLLLYHGFVLHNGAAPEESDSETQLGGLQLVSDTLFDAYDYVALGHIHKPQWVRRDRIRYSGSLMKYSFSECLQLERERQLYHHDDSVTSKTGDADFAWNTGTAFGTCNAVRRFHSGRTDRLGIDSQCNRKAAGCLSKHAGVELCRTGTPPAASSGNRSGSRRRTIAAGLGDGIL